MKKVRIIEKKDTIFVYFKNKLLFQQELFKLEDTIFKKRVWWSFYLSKELEKYGISLSHSKVKKAMGK